MTDNADLFTPSADAEAPKVQAASAAKEPTVGDEVEYSFYNNDVRPGTIVKVVTDTETSRLERRVDIELEPGVFAYAVAYSRLPSKVTWRWPGDGA